MNVKFTENKRKKYAKNNSYMCSSTCNFVFEIKTMGQLFGVIQEDLRGNVIRRISLFTGESEPKVEELIPVWEAIILGGLLKLIRNRIRFNALYNFILQKPIPRLAIEELQAGNATKLQLEEISQYGEGLIGILIPDKKSAIAMLISRELGCKSSSFLKGLSVVFGLYGFKLKEEDYDSLKDWKSFAEFFIVKKGDFSILCPSNLRFSISDILLLSDVLKLDPEALVYLTDDAEREEVKSKSFLFDQKNLVYIFITLLLSGFTIWYTLFKSAPEPEITTDLEEVIPIDSLNKLNDSLTKAVLDSNRIKNDSLVTLNWPDGTKYEVPKKSILVDLHAYLIDSTQTSPLELSCQELIFDENTDLLVKPTDYLFKQLANQLNKSKNVDVQISAISSKDDKSSYKRGFIIKNRLVGEGLSFKKIRLQARVESLNSQLDSQVKFIFSKHNLLK
jgi:hypothetical protein